MPGNKNSGRRGINNEKALAEKQRQWREAIGTTKLLKRLNAFALGLKENGRIIEMSPQQVSVSIALLRKVLPDLQSTEITGDLDHHHHGLTDSQLDEQIRRQALAVGIAAGKAPQSRGNGADSVH